MYRDEVEAFSYFEQIGSKISGVLDEKTFLTGENIGNYRIEELVGSGGMANVYRASRKDGTFQRHSALKIIKRGIDTEEVISRFNYERSILAALKHENITQLYDAGVTGKGLPYFVMEYIDGEDIISYSQNHQLSRNERLKLFLQVCNAIDFAHKNLIIHRDIKPGNIIVENGGKVKLMDFGIAKILRNEKDDFLTRADTRILTREYASPEQIKGDIVNTTTDIFQSGVLLYELLSNQKAYNKEHKKHIFEFKEKQIPSEIRSIIETATRENPGERYSSAEALKGDILNFLHQRPVKARGNTFAYRSRKFVIRNKVALIASLLVFVLVGFITGKYITDITRARKAAAYRSMHANSTMNFMLSTFANQLPRNAGGDTLSVFDLMNRMEYQLQHDKTFFKENLSRIYNLLGDINFRYKNFEKSYAYYHNALQHHVDDPFDLTFSARHKYIAYVGLGRHFYTMQLHDSARHYYQRAIVLANKRNINPIEAYTGWGKVELLTNKYNVADSLFQSGMIHAGKPNIPSKETVAFFYGVYGNFLARYFPHENRDLIDSLFRASISIYNKPVRYNSNMDFERKRDFAGYYQRRDTITGPPLKEQHPTSYAEVINYYGIFHYRMEDYDSAAYYFKAAYDANAKYYGESSIVALENASNLGVIYREMGNTSKALETFRECWEQSKNNNDIQPAFTLNFYQNYAGTLYLEERYEESLKAFDTVLMLRENYTPDNIFAINHAYRNIGQNFHKLNQHRKALEYLQKVVDNHQESADDKGFQDINAWLQIILVYGDMGNYAKLQNTYHLNEGTIKRRFGDDSPYLHKNIVATANALMAMQRHYEATKLIKPALHDSIESTEKNYLHFLYGKAQFNAGNAAIADSIMNTLMAQENLELKVKKEVENFYNR